MHRFDEKLRDHGLVLRRGHLRTLQINVGRKCNQTCRHCHVDAAPWRTEMINEEDAKRVGAWIVRYRPEIVDITGGAPELSAFFRYFVETGRSAGSHIIDRNNLTIIETKSFRWLPDYLAQHEVEVVASLPCYSSANVDAQRGEGVFEKSISALRKLNAVGYGTQLPLRLVYNPLGATLPGPQAELEADYKEALRRDYGIVFTRCSPSPISRSRDSPTICEAKGAGTNISSFWQTASIPPPWKG
jgi:radical SAM/Cys-rich protein